MNSQSSSLVPGDGPHEPRRLNDRVPLRHDREIEVVRRISQTLFQHLEIDELVETTLHSALVEVGAEAGSILLADVHSKQLIFHHSIGSHPVPRGTSIPWDRGIAGSVFHSGEPVILDDVKANEHHFHGIDQATGFQTHDMITLPLKRWKGNPIGVMNVLNKREGKLDEEDLALLTIVSAFAALAIQQARLSEEAKLAEVVRLLGNIGHDLKNLLQPVVSGVWLIRSELDPIFADRNQNTGGYDASKAICEELLTMIERTSERIHDRVKEIADCVKGLSAPPQFAPCQIAAVIDEVLQTLRVLASDKEISLQTRTLDNLPIIQADHRRLYNAFYNLVNNAIPEVSPGGSITLSGQDDPARQAILVSVVDTGRGMSSDVREKLFTDKAISTKVGGTGLGTKIVKDVIEAHRGEIRVESTIGVGTIFQIRLPLNPLSSTIS